MCFAYAFALHLQAGSGVLVRLTGLAELDADLDYASALARWDCEIELQRLGPADQSAAQALQTLMSACHARLMADVTLGGAAQRLMLSSSDGLEFSSVSGGELPAHTARMRYEIYSNLNPQTLGA